MTHPIVQEDIEGIFRIVGNDLYRLQGKRVLITGGTGFIDCWLLESFTWVNDRLNLGASALVLTRDHDGFQKKVPHLAAHPSIQFHIGDVRNINFPEGEFSHIIHAATSASAKLNDEDPLLMFDTIVEGTRHTLDFAAQCHASKFLLTSSASGSAWIPPGISNIWNRCGTWVMRPGRAGKGRKYKIQDRGV